VKSLPAVSLSDSGAVWIKDPDYVIRKGGMRSLAGDKILQLATPKQQLEEAID
jgi:hypothetical protein